MKKGFVQIPILIAIIATIVAISSMSYIGFEQYRGSQNNKPTTTSGSEVAPTLNLGDQSEIERIKKEIENLKQIKPSATQGSGNNNAPINVPGSITSPSSKKEVVAPVGTSPKVELPVSNQPIISSPAVDPTNASCASIRTEFDDFKDQYTKIYSKSVEISNTYNNVRAAPDALSGTAYFDYLYSQASAEKDDFVQKTSELKSLTSKLPVLNKDPGGQVASLKSNYEKGANDLNFAYLLNLDVYRKITDAFSYSFADSDKASFAAAKDRAINGINSFQSGNANYESLKVLYTNEYVNHACPDMCAGGYVLSKWTCVYTPPKVTSLSPASGAVDTIFSIKGRSFGDSPGTIIVGDRKANIISWSNTEVRFNTTGFFPSYYTVTINGVSAGTITTTK